MSIQIGDKAPEFSLYDTGKNRVSLSDYKGKEVVLLFFPLAFSGVCTKEMCLVRDDIEKYASLDATVLAISVDSLYTLGQFKAVHNLSFRCLSDFNKEVSRSYGALYDIFSYDMKGVSKRAAFVIDKKGVVKYAEVLKNPGDLPDFEAIHETISGLN